MSTNIVATKNFVNNVKSDFDNQIQNIHERIDDHNKRYRQTSFILTDSVNGFEYVVEMQNGNLVSYSPCIRIKVDKLPDKTSGAFNPAGLIISAECADGTTKEITNYTLSYVVDGVVTVTYMEAGVEHTTSFETDTYSIEPILQDFNYTANADGTFTINSWKGTLNGEPSTEMIIPELEDGLIII